MTFPTGWKYKHKIQVNHAPAEALVNFPMLITEAHLDAKVFTTAQSGGQDLRFTLDKDGVDILPHETEVFGAGNTRIHVKVPLIPRSTGTPDWLVDRKGAVSFTTAGDSFVHRAWRPITTYQGLYRNKIFTGDFDIELAYDFLDTPLDTQTRVLNWQINVGETVGSTTSFFRVVIERGSANGIRFNAFDGSNNWLVSGFSDASGKIRITRVGSTFKVYYWHPTNARWEWNGDVSGRTITSVSTAGGIWPQLWMGQTADRPFNYQLTFTEGGQVIPATFEAWQAGFPTDELYVWYGNAAQTEAFYPFKNFNPTFSRFATAGHDIYWSCPDTNTIKCGSNLASETWSGIFFDARGIYGDADLTIDYDFTGSATPTASSHSLTMQMRIATANAVQVRVRMLPGGTFDFQAIGASIVTSPAIAGMLVGKLRITRVGSTFKAFYWHPTNARWEWNGDVAGLTVAANGGVTTENLLTQLYYSQVASTVMTATLANFKNNNLSMAVATPSPWDDKYIAVYHLNETGNGTAGEYKDATNNNLHAKGNLLAAGGAPTRVTSDWNYGQLFDSVAKDGIVTPTSDLFCPRYALTFEWMYKPTTIDKTWRLFGRVPDVWEVYTDGQGDGMRVATIPVNYAYIEDDVALVAGQNLHLSAVYDLQNATTIDKLRLYGNGARNTINTNYLPETWINQFHDGVTLPTNRFVAIGCSQDGLNNHINGMVDEVRYSSVARSASWINATYQTLFLASAFAVKASPHYGIYGENFHYVGSPNHVDALGLPHQANGHFDQVLSHVSYTNGTNYVLKSGYGGQSEVGEQLTFVTKNRATTQAHKTADTTVYSSDHFQRLYSVVDSGTTFAGALIMTVPTSDQATLMTSYSYGGATATSFGTRGSICHLASSRGAGATLLMMYVATTGYLFAVAIGASTSDNPMTTYDAVKSIFNLGGTDFYPIAYGCGDRGGCLVAITNGANLEINDFSNQIGAMMTAGMTKTVLNTNGWWPKTKDNIALASSFNGSFKFVFFRDAAAPNTLRYCVYDAANGFVTSGTITTAMIAGDYGFCATYDIGHWRRFERCYVYYLNSTGQLCSRLLQVANLPADGRNYYDNGWWNPGAGFSLGAETILTDLAIVPKANNIQAMKRAFRQNGVVFQNSSGDLYLYRHIIPVTPPVLGVSDAFRYVPESEGWQTQTAFSPPMTFNDKTLVCWNAQTTSYANIWNHTTKQWLYPVRKRISNYYDDDHNMPLVRIGADGRIWSLMGGRTGAAIESLKVYRSHKLLGDGDISDILDFSKWSYLGSPHAASRGYKGFFVDNHGGCQILIYTNLHSYNMTSYRDGAFRSSPATSRPVLFDKILVGNNGENGYSGMPMGKEGPEFYPDLKSYHLTIPFANYGLGTLYRNTQLNYVKLVAQLDGKVRGYRADGKECVLPIGQTIAKSSNNTRLDPFADGDVLWGSYLSAADTKPLWTANQSGITLGACRVHNDTVWQCVNIGANVDPFNGTVIDTGIWDQVNAGNQSVSGNEVLFDFPNSGSLESSITTKATFAGDFELIVTFCLVNYLTSPTGQHTISLEVWDGAAWTAIYRNYNFSPWNKHGNHVRNSLGQWVNSSDVKNDPPLKGRLRLRRVGSTIYASMSGFTDVCSLWEWNLANSEHTSSLTTANPVKIRLAAAQGGTPFSVKVSDLFMVSGATYTCGPTAPFPAIPTYRQQVTDNQVLWQYVCPNLDKAISQGGESTPVSFHNSNQLRVGSLIDTGGNISFLNSFFDGSNWTVREEPFSFAARAEYFNNAVSPTNLMSNIQPYGLTQTYIPAMSKSIDYGVNWKSQELLYDPNAAELRGSVYTTTSAHAFSSTGSVLWAITAGEINVAFMGEYLLDWGLSQSRTVFADQFNGYFSGV